MGLLAQVLAYLQVKHFAESQLTVHKDLNMINQSVTRGLAVGHEFFSMRCEQCQSQCWHTNTFKKCSSQTCNVNSHTGMARARWVLKCFGGRHAQVRRECSHCGDCHTFATSGVGAQQAHSLNEGEKNFPKQTL